MFKFLKRKRKNKEEMSEWLDGLRDSFIALQSDTEALLHLPPCEAHKEVLNLAYKSCKGLTNILLTMGGKSTIL